MMSEEKTKNNIEYILLACCTCKRPNMLKDMMNSIDTLILPDGIKVEILIIDNDAEQSAKQMVEDMRQNLKLAVHYFVEEKRGLSKARNKLLQKAIELNASHIMMFDDDEILTENSLIEHINLYNNYVEEIISSGIVINKFDENTPAFIKNNIVFKQKTTKQTGKIKNSCASGNVFFPVSMLKKNELKFSEEYVFMGGEDGDFFKKASECGYTIVQNSESVLYETVTSARANMDYILKKAYYNGYSSSFMKFKEQKNNFARYLYMLKQFVSLLINCIICLPSLLFGKIVFCNIIAIVVRTFGKIKGAQKIKPMNFYREIYGN